MPKRKKKTTKQSSSTSKNKKTTEQSSDQANSSDIKKNKNSFDQSNIGTIPDEEKRSIQRISEELREKNLGYYDFKNMNCRIHNIPLNRYKTQENHNEEPFPVHCKKCIPIPESWLKVS
ncbi:MAG: hypothetical protein ACW981_01090 [Candidatus Hodarchaeales archaeon]|jgi:hypothetical protein